MNYRYIIVLLIILVSCSKDSSVENGLSFGASSYSLDNTYFYPSGTGATSGSITNKDFLIILTDGQIESFSPVTNDFVYTAGTSNSVLLILRKYSDVVLPLLEVPDGIYTFNATGQNDLIIQANFAFGCTVSNNSNLESCSDSFRILTSSEEPTSGNIEIQSQGNDRFLLNYEFEFADRDKIEGSFSGTIQKGNTIIDLF